MVCRHMLTFLKQLLVEYTFLQKKTLVTLDAAHFFVIFRGQTKIP